MSKHLPPFRLFIVLLALTSNTVASGQIDRSYHQIIQIDEVDHIQFNLLDNYTLHTWAGTSIMMEAYVRVDKGNMDILNFLVKQGRYDLDVQKSEDGLAIKTKPERNKPLRVQDGVCTEFVKIDLYVPEDYLIKNKTELERRHETLLASGKN